MDIREYSYGIYKYTDNETGNIVYIGKDSHIDKNQRHKEHLYPSNYDSQQFNRVLQNNPNRYDYSVWYHVNTIDELNQLEFDLINLYRPKFNFKHGGQGGYINKDFEYTVVKCGMRNGKQNYCIQSMFRKPLIQSIDYTFLDDICSKLNNGKLTPNDVKQMKRKIKPSLETNLKRSKNNSTGFYRVHKHLDKTCKQGFAWRYEYYGENGKHKRFQRVNFFELKKEVAKRKLPWQIVDIDKAVNTIKSIVAI